MNSAVIWLVLVIVLLAIEIATLGLTTVWFAGGAAAAFISTFFGASMEITYEMKSADASFDRR